MRDLHRLAPMPPSLCSLAGFLRPISTTPLGLAPPRQARTHRHRVRMTTTPEPRRLLSIRPRPCGRSGPELRSLSHLHVPVPHPFACRDPTRPRQKARRSLQTTPRDETSLAARSGATGEDASHRCLQSTDDTSTLRTVRFPAAPPSASRPPSCAHPLLSRRASPGWSIA
jgi:hypothetical protein